MQNGTGYFEHERLDAYRVAREVLEALTGKRGDFTGHAWLYNQAARAAGSVVLNVAEGASLRSPGAKKRHYGIALGSCGELGAALDVAIALGVPGLSEVVVLNRREGQMLGKLAR